MPTILTLAERKNPRIRHLDLEFRFWQKVDINTVSYDTCWIWIGTLNYFGYGQLAYRGKNYQAHRISYWIYKTFYKNNFIKNSLIHACHKCDNPSCVNPNHIFLGSASENKQDSINKDRVPIGENCWNSILTSSQILEIRQLYATGKYIQRKLAKRFNVTRSTISSIINKNCWTHIK